MATQDIPKRFSFTKQAIETLPHTDQQQDFYDTKTPHLVVRVARKKVFYWYGKVRGRAQRIKLGVFPDLSIENARKFAQRISANVAEGKPPIEEHRDGTTLGQLFQTYLDVWAKPRKKSWRQDQYAYDRHLKHWHNRRLSDITKADLQRLHAAIGTKHGTVTANRVRSLLSKMWNVASEHGHWDGDSPVSAVKKFPEQERERYLRADELPGFFAQLDADENQDYADYVRLSLFTGGRQANVLAMRWDQIHFERAEWTIPAAQFKSGKAQTIPLSDEAVQVLQKRKEQTAADRVFPGRGVTKHLTRPGKWWEALLLRCKLSENLTMHDLRRTLAAWQAAGGASLLVIGKGLGHKDSRSTQVYARLDLEPVRKSMSAAGKAIAAAAKPVEKHEQTPVPKSPPSDETAENSPQTDVEMDRMLSELITYDEWLEMKKDANASAAVTAALARADEDHIAIPSQPPTCIDRILSGAKSATKTVEEVLGNLPTAIAYAYSDWMCMREDIEIMVRQAQESTDPKRQLAVMYELGCVVGRLRAEMEEVTTGRHRRQGAKRELNQFLEVGRTKVKLNKIQKQYGGSRTAARKLLSEKELGYRQIVRHDRQEKHSPIHWKILERLYDPTSARPFVRFLSSLLNKYIDENR